MPFSSPSPQRVFRLIIAESFLLSVAGGQAAGYRESILGKAKDTLERVGRAYRLGEFSYTDLLTAQRTYFEAHLTYLSALRELRTAEARIEGLLLTGSLDEPAGTTP